MNKQINEQTDEQINSHHAKNLILFQFFLHRKKFTVF